jgi:hypothetical protein
LNLNNEHFSLWNLEFGHVIGKVILFWKKERGIKAQFFKPFEDYHSSTLDVLAQIIIFF